MFSVLLKCPCALCVCAFISQFNCVRYSIHLIGVFYASSDSLTISFASLFSLFTIVYPFIRGTVRAAIQNTPGISIHVTSLIQNHTILQTKHFQSIDTTTSLQTCIIFRGQTTSSLFCCCSGCCCSGCCCASNIDISKLIWYILAIWKFYHGS